MLREITHDEISQYERDGAICLRALFDPIWVTRIGDALERLLNTERGKRGDLTAPDSPGRFNNATFMWRFDPDFRDFVFQSPAAEIARQLMRSRTSRFFYDHLFVKEPRTRETTPWHHDQPYWPVPTLRWPAKRSGFDLVDSRYRCATREVRVLELGRRTRRLPRASLVGHSRLVGQCLGNAAPAGASHALDRRRRGLCAGAGLVQPAARSDAHARTAVRRREIPARR